MCRCDTASWVNGFGHQQQTNIGVASYRRSMKGCSESLGVAWKLRDGDRSWDRYFAELQRFRDANNHTYAQLSYPQKNGLGRWLNKQQSKNV